MMKVPLFLRKPVCKRSLIGLATALVVLGLFAWDLDRPPHQEATMKPEIELLGPPKLAANGLEDGDMDRLTTTVRNPVLFETAVAKAKARNPALYSCEVEAVWRASTFSHHPGWAQVVGDDAALVSAISACWAEEINDCFRRDPLTVGNGLTARVYCAATQATPYESSWAVRFSSGSLHWQENAHEWLSYFKTVLISWKQTGRGC